MRSKSIGKTQARGTFMTGEMGSNKVPLGGRIVKGGDLRNKPASGKGKMPKTV